MDNLRNFAPVLAATHSIGGRFVLKSGDTVVKASSTRHLPLLVIRLLWITLPGSRRAADIGSAAGGGAVTLEIWC